MAEKVLAAVRTGPSKTEIRDYPMPDIPEDAALLKMEVGGICGTDVKLYKHPPSAAPVTTRKLVAASRMIVRSATNRPASLRNGV